MGSTFHSLTYMQPFYRRSIEDVVESTTLQNNGAALNVLRQIANSKDFHVDDQLLSELGPLKDPMEHLIEYLSLGEGDVDPEIYRDTPTLERMVERSRQRGELKQLALQEVSKAITILEERERWTEEDFRAKQQTQEAENALVNQAQSKARALHAEQVKHFEEVRRKREEQKAAYIAFVSEEGMRFREVLGSPYDHDPDVIRAALGNNGWVIQIIPETALQDMGSEYLLLALTTTPEAIGCLSPSVVNDPMFIAKVCVKNYAILSYCEQSLRGDLAFISYVVESLRSKQVVTARPLSSRGVREEVENVLSILQYLHDRTHRSLMLEMLRVAQSWVTLAEEIESQDLIAILSCHAQMIKIVDSTLTGDDQFITDMVRDQPLYEKHVPNRVIVDAMWLGCIHPRVLAIRLELVYEAIKMCPQAITVIPQPILQSRRFIARACVVAPRILECMPLLQNKPFLLQDIVDNLEKESVVMTPALLINRIKTLAILLSHLKQNASFVQRFLKVIGTWILSVDPRFRANSLFITHLVRSHEVLFDALNPEVIKGGRLIEAVLLDNPFFITIVEKRGWRMPDKQIPRYIRRNPMILGALRDPKYAEWILMTLESVAGDCVYKRYPEDILPLIHFHHELFRYAYRNKALVMQMLEITMGILERCTSSFPREEDALRVIEEASQVVKIIIPADTPMNNSLIRDVVRSCGFMVRGLPEAWRKDRVFIQNCVRENPRALWGADESLRIDLDYVLSLSEIHSGVLWGASQTLKGDKSCILYGASKNPDILRFATRSLRKDGDFVLEVFRVNPHTIRGASHSLLNDEAFIESASRKYPEIINYLSPRCRERFLAYLRRKEAVNRLANGLQRMHI